MDGDVLKFLRRKADFFEGFANALPELHRAWLWNQVTDMRRLLNELEKSQRDLMCRYEYYKMTQVPSGYRVVKDDRERIGGFIVDQNLTEKKAK